jgi:hypothetical protein
LGEEYLATGPDPKVGSFYHAESAACFGNGSLDAGQAPPDESQIRKASEEDELRAPLWRRWVAAR